MKLLSKILGEYTIKASISKILAALRVSIAGLANAWRHELAFRLEICGAILLFPIIYVLPLTLIYKLILIILYVMIIIAELANSAIENVVDLASQEIHPLAKAAKDIASSIVLVTILLNLIIWFIVLYTQLIIPA